MGLAIGARCLGTWCRDLGSRPVRERTGQSTMTTLCDERPEVVEAVSKRKSKLPKSVRRSRSARGERTERRTEAERAPATPGLGHTLVGAEVMLATGTGGVVKRAMH